MGHPGSEEMALPILEAVSEAVGAPIASLPPLSAAIDLDGLDTIVTGEDGHDVTVTFRYAGRRVLVHSNETVYVRPLQEPRRIEPPTASDR
jgi:hypothetical protein